VISVQAETVNEAAVNAE